MNKVKLAICMQDLEYQARFVNCLMNHYKHQYEVHVFTDVEELKATNPQTYSCVIMDEYTIEDMANFVEEGVKLLCLAEAESGDEKYASEKIAYTGKYQEVYKITEIIQQLTVDNLNRKCRTAKKRTVIYSFTKEALQIAMTELLAELHGEKEQVLVLDLQPFSSFGEQEQQEFHMGLEDILAVATTGNFSRGRLLECIGHAGNWDYVYPVRNTECLVEGKAKLYETVLELLENELGYERILINFGGVFSGWMDFLAQCDEIYILTGKEKDRNWREQAFRDELRRREKEGLYQKVKHIEVPVTSATEEKWQEILEKWRYGFLGEGLRQVINRESDYGEIM